MRNLIVILLAVFTLLSCGTKESKKETKEEVYNVVLQEQEYYELCGVPASYVNEAVNLISGVNFRKEVLAGFYETGEGIDLLKMFSENVYSDELFSLLDGEYTKERIVALAKISQEYPDFCLVDAVYLNDYEITNIAKAKDLRETFHISEQKMTMELYKLANTEIPMSFLKKISRLKEECRYHKIMWICKNPEREKIVDATLLLENESYSTVELMVVMGFDTKKAHLLKDLKIEDKEVIIKWNLGKEEINLLKKYKKIHNRVFSLEDYYKEFPKESKFLINSVKVALKAEWHLSMKDIIVFKRFNKSLEEIEYHCLQARTNETSN